MKIKITQILTLCLLSSSIHSLSYNAPINDSPHNNQDGFSVHIAGGYLGGEAHEYVYDEMGRTISQLNWNLDGAAIIKGEMNANLFPWLTANINGWGTLDSSDAVMDDYDWFNPNQQRWTHWSHHSDTTLNSADNIDINLRGWFVNTPQSKLGVTLGYAQTSFDFLANGGCYQYANGLYNGCFANEPMIGYQQTFETTYFGLTGKYLFNNVELNATFKYSPWVDASDVDEHYARNLTFTDNSDNSTFSSVNLSAGYYVSPSFKFFLEGIYNNFSNGKGDTLLNDNMGHLFQINDAAGIENNNYVLAAGIQYIVH